MFWRIPSEFSPVDLRAIADGLTVSESGQAANPTEVQSIVARVFPNLFAASDSFHSKQKKPKKPKTKRKPKAPAKPKKSNVEDVVDGEFNSSFQLAR